MSELEARGPYERLHAAAATSAHPDQLFFVMEKRQRARLQQRFRANLRSKRVICLDIPDRYAFMDPALVRLLEAKVSRLL